MARLAKRGHIKIKFFPIKIFDSRQISECNRTYLGIIKIFYFSLISADLGDSLVVTICVRTFRKMSFEAKLPEILPG